jgi:hypothetical protein
MNGVALAALQQIRVCDDLYNKPDIHRATDLLRIMMLYRGFT